MAEVVFESVSTSGGSTQLNISPDVAQTFKAQSDHNITAVEINWGRHYTTTATITVSIQGVDGAGEPDGNALATSSALTYNDLVYDDIRKDKISFISPCDVTEDTFYAIVMEISTHVATSLHVALGSQPAGWKIYSQGPSWSLYGGYGAIGIKIYGTLVEVTTEAISDLGIDHAKGNGTAYGANITERGFEVRLAFAGTLYGYIEHSIAGFSTGTVSYNIDTGKWEGTITKTVTETGTFSEGAFTDDLGRFPIAVSSDKLFPGETYDYRARATIDGTVYYGDYVEFTTNTYPSGYPPSPDDLSDGNPVEPIVPIEPIEWELPEFIWELPEIELPPWILPDLPDWAFPDYPPMSFVGDFYYRKPYTKKDLDDLRKKCIIYSKNSVEFALVLRHNMNVLREFFNMMTNYMDKEEFNDFTDLIPPQRLKELYLDPLNLVDFRDMINGFIRNTIDNNIAVNRNFKLIQDGLSDYETESDDAYFKEINSNIKTVTEDNPDVHRLKKKIDSLNQEVSMNFSNIMRNLKILRARLL